MGRSTSKRILMLLENCSFPRDDRVRREARALIAAGYTITLISPASAGQSRRELVEGVMVHRYKMPPEGKGFLGYFWEYAYSMTVIFWMSLSVLIREKFDVVHAHQPPDLFGLIAGFYKLFGKKYVLDHHDLAPDLYEARFRGKVKPGIRSILVLLEKISCRFADHVIATNESYKRIEMQRDHVPEERITIVRNGPDLHEVYRTAPDPAIRRDGKIVIGYVGVVGTQDGVDNLLRAMKHLVFDLGRRDAICIIVGSGDALPELESLARELSLSDYVRFTGWVDGEDQVRRYLNSMDICAAPEPSDPYNQCSTAAKVMEYMAVGKPVVSFDNTEHRFSAQEGALYARPGDEMDFARKLAFLMDNPSERERIGTLGFQRIKDRLAWQHQSAALVSAYSSLFPDMNGSRR
jgi:glycosyltransferase involved in cell wall biosynthesis